MFSTSMRRLTFAGILLLAVVTNSCRGTHEIRELKTSSAPHISKLFLTNGKTIQFNDDLGWYDVTDSVIDGMTLDSQHVTISVHDVRAVETVREYSLVFLYGTALVAMGVAAYALFKLFSLI